MVQRQSQLFGKTRRNVSKDEVSINAQLLIRGGFVEKLQSGVYGFLPLGLRVLRKVEAVIRQGMERVQGQELFLPALQPKDLWVRTGRWSSISVMYHLKDSGGHELGLATTHEDVITEFAKESIRSYRDLPMRVYQVQTKFRDEPRAKSGLIRGKEFIMKDLYSFHESEADLEPYYQSVKREYLAILQSLELDARVVEASGGDFSKAHSHEFQVESPAGEDTILVCNRCDVAFNEEVTKAEGISECPNGHGALRVTTGIEVGNIFHLGTRFSEALDLTFLDRDGNRKPVVLASYGMGPTRLVGTLAEVHHDERGLRWPAVVSPFDVHLVALGDEGRAQAEELIPALEKAGLDVLFDDREDSAGAKFADADLIGIHHRIVTSAKTAAKGTVEYRTRGNEAAEHGTPKSVLAKLR